MMSAEQRIMASIANVENIMARGGRILPSKYLTPLSSKYSRWFDKSQYFKVDVVQCLQELIGQLCWAV